jgi:hypothetical protein
MVSLRKAHCRRTRQITQHDRHLPRKQHGHLSQPAAKLVSLLRRQIASHELFLAHAFPPTDRSDPNTIPVVAPHAGQLTQSQAGDRGQCGFTSGDWQPPQTGGRAAAEGPAESVIFVSQEAARAGQLVSQGGPESGVSSSGGHVLSERLADDIGHWFAIDLGDGFDVVAQRVIEAHGHGSRCHATIVA